MRHVALLAESGTAAPGKVPKKESIFGRGASEQKMDRLHGRDQRRQNSTAARRHQGHEAQRGGREREREREPMRRPGLWGHNVRARVLPRAFSRLFL